MCARARRRVGMQCLLCGSRVLFVDWRVEEPSRCHQPDTPKKPQSMASSVDLEVGPVDFPQSVHTRIGNAKLGAQTHDLDPKSLPVLPVRLRRVTAPINVRRGHKGGVKAQGS